MGVFKEMDPEVAARAIEGYQDVLSPAAEEQSKFYSQFSCPRCRCALDERIDARTAFTGDSPLAKSILECANCGYTIDPHTNVVLVFGDASKIPVETSPIAVGPFIPDI